MSARDIVVKPITAAAARAVVHRFHYSGSSVTNSQVHLGAFLHGRLLGAMQFGPSMDKAKIQGLVRDTTWNGFIELNRMAFSDALPRNSESRCIAVALRLLRATYPHLEWVVSFADGVQCGDGAIYRAGGWWLTKCEESKQIIEMPDGTRATAMSLTHAGSSNARAAAAKACGIPIPQTASMLPFFAAGARIVPGFMCRYIFPLWSNVRERLTCPILPYSTIADRGARMYRGQRPGSSDGAAPAVQAGEGGSTPTPGLP